MNNLNYPLRVSKELAPYRFSRRQMMEQKINEENIENNLVFCIDPPKAFAIKYQDLFLEIRHIRPKYVCFLFRLNCDFGFFIKPWPNRLCTWTTSQERVDLDCNFWGCLPFKLTTVGEVWLPLQWIQWKRKRHAGSVIAQSTYSNHITLVWRTDWCKA